MGLKQQIFELLVRAIVLLTAIPIHELSHALAAKKLGDDTATRAGRLTLNPFSHFDLFGTICLLTVGIGWAKPVPIDPRNFAHPKRDMALSSAAGPASNFVMAWLTMILAKICYYMPYSAVTDTLYIIFINMCLVNITLGIFNLMPVPPFDGSRIFGFFLPEKLYWGVMKYERYILFGMMLLLWSGLLSGPLGILNHGAFKILNRLTLGIDRLAWSFM